MNKDFLNQISGRRILNTVNEIEELAAGSEGDRIAYAFSHIEDAIFKYIKSYAYELNKTYTVLTRNLDFYEDAFGNLYVLLDSDKDTCVACSTHVDASVPEGNFDGFLGAAVGLEIMRVLFEQEASFKSGFCLMVFRAGEALSTGVPFLGSRVATAQIRKEDLKAIEYGVEKKMNLEAVFDYKKMKKQKIYNSLDTGYMYGGRYKCLLEIHVGDELGVAVDCKSCDQTVVERIGNVHQFLFGKKLSRVKTEMAFDADNFMKVGVPAGVVMVEKTQQSIEIGAKLVAGTLVSFAG